MKYRALPLLFATLLLAAVPAFAADTPDVFEAVTHHTVDNDGVDIHYVTLGEGPAVLFVHGFPDFWYTWRHQMRALADGGYRAVAMDTRAYNKSGKPEGVESYAIEHLLSDVAAVIDDLGLDDVVLAGHDWGGAISWRFAMEHPEKVSHLVIFNLTHPRGYLTVRRNATPEQKAATQYIQEFQKPDAASRFTPQMLAMMVGRESDLVRQRYQEAFERSSIDGMLNYYRAIWPDLESGEFAEEAPSLPMPVLQFHGLKDTAVDKDGLRDTWNWIDADYTLVTIPTAGHWVQGEAAELVSTTMKGWLDARMEP